MSTQTGKNSQIGLLIYLILSAEKEKNNNTPTSKIKILAKKV